jgi:signal transduction histidine kinase
LHTEPRWVEAEGPTIRTTAVVNAIVCLTFAVVSSALSEALRRALGRSRELEEELRSLNRNLEDRMEALERTLRHVNLFARAVSHDLRNPITAASESLRLGRDAEGASRESLLSLAMENLLRADKMLLGLRDLMRTIGSPEARERVDLEAAAREVLDELAVVRGGAPLPVQLGAGLGSAFARREELMVVYRNLIANAIDHNEGTEGLVVEVGRDARGSEPVLYVRDNGKGIPPALQDRIFEPFRRGEDSKQGLGLGLALVEAVVSHAGGRVFVESQPGGGTTIFFTFPESPPSCAP